MRFSWVFGWALGLVACGGAGDEDAAGGSAAAGAAGGAVGGGGSAGGGSAGGGAGGANGGAGGSDGPAGPCVPDRAAFDATVAAQLDTWCGRCHGETGVYGAPYGLRDYDALLTGLEGERRVDRIVARLGAGTMPPAGQPQPDTDARRAILDWATCGEHRGTPPDGPPPGGFEVDRPVLPDPGEPPPGTEFFELRADRYEVPRDEDDHYRCFSFEVPVGEDRFIRRIETVVDDARVVHHAVLIPGAEGLAPGENGRCRNANALELLYGWAPGQGALQFAEGGMRVRPGDRVTLQVHYNNTARHPDVRDSSGVRIYHGPVEGPEVGMLIFGPLQFAVPSRSDGDATGSCRLPQDARLIASFPHMHELGHSFEQTIERADGTTEPLITLRGWDFNSQYIYETPTDLRAGDVVRTRCVFRNPTDRTVGFGPRTTDEMCFNFAYVTPPPRDGYCNESEDAPFVYEPGACAPAGIETLVPEPVEGRLTVGPNPDLGGGALPEGLWVVDGAAVTLPSAQVAGTTIDLEASRVDVAGFVGFAGTEARLDLGMSLHIATSALTVDRAIPVSVAGEMATVADAPSRLAFSPTCGTVPGNGALYYGHEDGRVQIGVHITGGPIELFFRLFLRPAN